MVWNGMASSSLYYFLMCDVFCTRRLFVHHSSIISCWLRDSSLAHVLHYWLVMLEPAIQLIKYSILVERHIQTRLSTAKMYDLAPIYLAAYSENHLKTANSSCVCSIKYMPPFILREGEHLYLAQEPFWLFLFFSYHTKIGILGVIAALMASLGLLAYKRWFFHSSWRKIYVWTTLIVTFFSGFQILLIFRCG